MNTDNPFDADVSDIPSLSGGEEIDENEVYDGGPKPEGEYHVKVDDVKVEKKKKGNGVKLIHVTFVLEILQPSKYAGGKFFYQETNVYHSDSEEAQKIAKNNLMKFYLALGLSSQPDSFRDVVSNECFTVMRHREYPSQGETRIAEDTERFTPVDGQPQGPFDDDSGNDTETSDDSFEDDDVPF